MAETKYDLLLVDTNKEKKIYNQPWYKERLRTRYIKDKKKGDSSHFLSGKNWKFIKDGLDDFRDGLPPTCDGDVFIKKNGTGIAPNIQGSSDNISSVKQPAIRGRFTKEEICFSKLTPQQQQRRDHIDEIEYGLTQHPLALYPHLEECLPPELFEEVVDILDPEMNLASDEEDYEDDENSSPSKRSASSRVSLDQQSDKLQGEEIGRVRNPYRWLPRKEEKDKKDKKKASERRSSSPSQDEHIKAVTKDFCDWVSGLGGESNNIEESTITSLFASGYETKPALSVPIHVVELTNVPPELRMSATVPQQTEEERTTPEDLQKPQQWKYSGNYEPTWVKFKYGAWYLSPKSWKKRAATEQLQDPKELKNQEMSEAKKKSNALDTDLAPMHGSKAFMEFIDSKKSARRPEFLDRVAEIQEQTAREEQLKLEAEMAKQRKLNSRQKRANKSKD